MNIIIRTIPWIIDNMNYDVLISNKNRWFANLQLIKAITGIFRSSPRKTERDACISSIFSFRRFTWENEMGIIMLLWRNCSGNQSRPFRIVARFRQSDQTVKRSNDQNGMFRINVFKPLPGCWVSSENNLTGSDSSHGFMIDNRSFLSFLGWSWFLSSGSGVRVLLSPEDSMGEGGSVRRDCTQ